MNIFVALATTGISRELQVIFMLVIFAVIIVAAYFVTNLVARVQKGSFTNKNLEIIEAISVGQQKTVQLVRVGKEYIIIGVSKNEINILQTLGKDDITINNDKDGQSVIPFKQILSRYNKAKEKGNVGDDHHETKD